MSRRLVERVCTWRVGEELECEVYETEGQTQERSEARIKNLDADSEVRALIVSESLQRFRGVVKYWLL
jgi:hypothetical protein